jgi:hypothetical protein
MRVTVYQLDTHRGPEDRRTTQFMISDCGQRRGRLRGFITRRKIWSQTIRVRFARSPLILRQSSVSDSLHARRLCESIPQPIFSPVRPLVQTGNTRRWGSEMMLWHLPCGRASTFVGGLCIHSTTILVDTNMRSGNRSQPREGTGTSFRIKQRMRARADARSPRSSPENEPIPGLRTVTAHVYYGIRRDANANKRKHLG